MCNGDSIYKGFFRADLMHGKGILKYENGDEYEGDFKYNKKDGEGVFKYKQSSNNFNLIRGDIYRGSFVKDKKAGFGIMYFANGDKYEGEWLDDVKHG